MDTASIPGIDPKRIYGTPSAPEFDLRAAATYLACDKGTVLNNLRGKAKKRRSRSRWARRKILTFAVEDLDAQKLKWAQGDGRYTVKAIARKLGWNEQKVYQALREAGLGKQERKSRNGKKRKPLRYRRALVLPANPELLAQRNGGINAATISKEEFRAFEQMIKDQKRKPGYSTEYELANAIGANDRGTKLELHECLELWVELGKLPAEKAIVETTTNRVRRGKPQTCTTTQEAMTYDRQAALELWNKECSAKTGDTQLKILLPSFGTPKPCAEIDAEMRKKGFIGRRLDEAKRLAGVTTHFLKGDFPGHKQVCERIDPKKKQPDPLKIIEEIFAKGPLLVNDYETGLSAQGLTRRQGLVMRAEAKLAYRAERLGFGGPWYCCIEGQTMPPAGSLPAVSGPEKALKVDRTPPAPLTVQSTFPKKPKRKGPYKGVRVLGILKAFKAKLKKGQNIKEAAEEIAGERGESFSSVERTYYRYRKPAD
jgi:hypothetical protein